MFSLKKYILYDKQGDRLIIQPASISDVYSIQGFVCLHLSSFLGNQLMEFD